MRNRSFQLCLIIMLSSLLFACDSSNKSEESAVNKETDSPQISQNNDSVREKDTVKNVFSGQLPLSPKVIKGKFENGMTYIIRKNSEPLNRAELRLVINAGSILVDDNQQGFAHFVEHMAFNGTQDFKKLEIVLKILIWHYM